MIYMNKQHKAEQYLLLYCQRMQISPMPRMITSLKDYRQFIRIELKQNRMPKLKRSLGRCFRRQNTIWIALRKHHSTVTLRHTIAHELVHLKHISLPHGHRFNQIVMAVIGDRY